MDRYAELENAKVWIALVLDHFGITDAKVPVKWNGRMTRKMGVCKNRRAGNVRSSSIELSPSLFERATREERDEVCAHEAAHAAVFLVHGFIKRGRKYDHHGPVWQNAMRSLGFTPKRCHSIDRAGVGQQTHKLTCKSCDGSLGSCTTRKANRFQSLADTPGRRVKLRCCGWQPVRMILIERVK